MTTRRKIILWVAAVYLAGAVGVVFFVSTAGKGGGGITHAQRAAALILPGMTREQAEAILPGYRYSWFHRVKDRSLSFLSGKPGVAPLNAPMISMSTGGAEACVYTVEGNAHIAVVYDHAGTVISPAQYQKR